MTVIMWWWLKTIFMNSEIKCMHSEKMSDLFLQVLVHIFLCSYTTSLFNSGFCSFTAYLQFSSAHCYSLLLTTLLSLRLALLWSSFPLQIVLFYLVVHPLSSHLFPYSALQCSTVYLSYSYVLYLDSSSINFLQFKFNLVTIHHFNFLLL